MPPQSVPARSSRITNRKRIPSTLSPVHLSPNSVPSHHALSYDHDQDTDQQLEDTGLASLAHDLNFRDVPQFIYHIRNSMFGEMSEMAGMSSTRKAEILNHRAKLPPFVTVAHVDALTASSTAIEREIAQLAQAGIVRRISIPRRGIGAAAVGDGIALTQEWHQLIHANESLTEHLKGKPVPR